MSTLNKSESFNKRLSSLHQSLGIPSDYLASCRLPVCHEPEVLVDAELDHYQRLQKLAPEAFAAWTAMKKAAKQASVTIFLISAFRGYQYQHDLILGKLRGGRSITEILKVNAAPGFSEHHTGRAVDIGTNEYDAVGIDFENSLAFQWLTKNAGDFGFTMTYPRDNPSGIDYEPWHWCFSDPEQQL